MTTRASFSGLLSFGMVQFPVRAYATSTDRSEESPLHIIHEACLAPVKQGYTCLACGEAVSSRIKGFQHDGHWYSVTPDDLAATEDPGEDDLHRVTVHLTVHPGYLSHLWFRRAYFLVPGSDAAERPYTLFGRALRDCKRTAIVTFMSRGKGHLGAVMPHPEFGLVLWSLYFADEVKQLADHGVSIAETKLTPKEIVLAKKLVESLDSKFVHEDFLDEGKERLRRVMTAKVAKLPIPKPIPVQETAPNVISIVELLQKSVKSVGEQKKAPKRRRHA